MQNTRTDSEVKVIKKKKLGTARTRAQSNHLIVRPKRSALPTALFQQTKLKHTYSNKNVYYIKLLVTFPDNSCKTCFTQVKW